MMRTAAFALSLALALPTAAQVPARPKPPVRNPGSFVHLTTRPWFTLDPASAFDAVSFIVTGNVYEPLIAFKSLVETDQFVPFLASEVPTRDNGLVSSDGRTYRFPIRKGVVFHEGQPLTPEDVRYSLLRFMLQDVEGGPSSLLLRPVLGAYGTRTPDGRITLDFKDAERAVRVEGDAVVVELREPSGHFLKVLASLPIVVSKAWAVANGEWDGTEAAWRRYNNRPLDKSYLHSRMNGTGPFKLAEADPARQLVLKRNERYWRAPAELSEVFLRVVPNKATRLWMLENGDADAGYLEDRDYAEARQLQDVRIVDCEQHTVLGESLFFTFEADPKSEFLGSGRLDGAGVPPDFFKDKDVREGFAYALDYEGLLRRGLGLRGKRAAGPFPDAFLPGQPPPRHRLDLDKARAAFRRARKGQVWEQGFAVTVAFSPSIAGRRVIAELLRANLERINPKFNLRVKVMPSQELYAAAEKHQLPLFIAGYYADYPDPQSLAFGLLHSAGYYPRAQRYFNPKMDRLIEKAASTADPDKRRKLYLEASRMAADDLPQVYTFNPTRFRAMREWVRERDQHQNVSNLNLNNFPYFYALSKG